jgi:hypothetical protein
MKTALFDVEAKMIAVNNSTIRTEFGPRIKCLDPNSHPKPIEKEILNLGTESNLSSEDSKKSLLTKNPSRLPKEAKKILKEWFLSNISNPYPK